LFKFLSSRAALAATVLIVLQGALIYSAVRPESPPSGRALAQFPTSLGSWTLLQEGVIQVLTVKDSNRREPLLGAVGPLQFEVVQYRLKSEYGADSRLESAGWDVLRWVSPTIPLEQVEAALPTGAKIAFDAQGAPAILFPNEWAMGYFTKRNADITLSDVPFSYREASEAFVTSSTPR